jgi:hypothetical protein
MQGTTVRKAFVALILASALPLAACNDDPDTPTSPTQAGPPVAIPAPEPTPTPTPTPTPPVDDRPVVTVTGGVFSLARSGAGDLDISFRIDDSTIVRGTAAMTTVVSGSQTFSTDAVRPGQTVTAEGRRTNGFLDATKITILTQAP